MSDPWATDGGVYLGFGSKATEGDPPPLTGRPLRYVGDRHVLTVAPNGSGKSRRLLLPNLAYLTGWSTVVVDPKGELCLMTAEHRRNAGSRIIILNPFNEFGLGSDGFNPVAALRAYETDGKAADDFVDDTMMLAEGLIRIEGREPHWSASAQDLITALIMYSKLKGRGLRDDGSRVPGSLAHVRSLLGRSSDGFKDVVTAVISEAIHQDCEELAVKISRYADISSEHRELNAILSTALTQTRWLDSRAVKADLEADTAFDWSSLKETPTTVYLILPARRLGTHSSWIRVMLASIVQGLMKDTRKAKVPVLLALDEFYALAEGDGFPVITRNMAMFRGFGIKLWTLFQDLSQATKLFGRDWESFAANAGVLQAFAPQDLVTADYLSKRTGQTTRTFLSHVEGRSQVPGAAETLTDNLNRNVGGFPLMMPQDLRNMDDGFGVLFSHKTKGTVRMYAPYPTELRDLKGITDLDPAG